MASVTKSGPWHSASETTKPI